MVKRLSPLRLLVLTLLDYRMSELTRLVCVRVWTTFHLRPLCGNQSWCWSKLSWCVFLHLFQIVLHVKLLLSCINVTRLMIQLLVDSHKAGTTWSICFLLEFISLSHQLHCDWWLHWMFFSTLTSSYGNQMGNLETFDCISLLVRGSLSPKKCGLTWTDCNPSELDQWRFACNCGGICLFFQISEVLSGLWIQNL